MNPKQSLIAKLQNKSAITGVIGLGYVGLPLSLRYAEAGYKVIDFDIDSDKAKQLNNGQSYIRHFGGEKVQATNKSGFEVTTDFTRITEADALIKCVPPPFELQAKSIVACLNTWWENWPSRRPKAQTCKHVKKGTT